MGKQIDEINKMLAGAEAPVTDECCIYRVPFNIRRHKEDAYTPMVVSIGPFHHNTLDRLHNMQRHKLNYCKAILQRTQTTPATWIDYIERMEPQIRRCYSDPVHFSKEKLVEIIFVDSGFILELFCRYSEERSNWSKDDVCLSKSWLRLSIRQDLLLLENQIPFFVLQSLYEAFVSTSNKFIWLTVYYFYCYKSSISSCDDTISINHFTDLLRIFHSPTKIDVDKPNTQHPTVFSVCLETCLKNGKVMKVLDRIKHEVRWMKLKIKDTLSCQRKERSEWTLPSATELHEAGVKFELNNKTCLVDLKFKKPVLTIPQLKVEDWTETLFRNMVALEQCHFQGESYITHYVQIMDFLVNTTRDVDFLVREGILLNWLGDSASVANLFNGLGKNITISEIPDYSLLYQELNAFHRSRWNNLKSTLRLNYCKTAWQTIATFAAILLLFLAIVQTLCSVLQVKPQ
ncbi:hypothetical protein Fmac_000766 [Flemingia macrophylla]|uniref:Uncharacterized protein n=1 Tax=Flemingia macrophylla TaxID=520843 RepID=A0ABD1NF61_9FABA